jgi:hypothetical protein
MIFKIYHVAKINDIYNLTAYFGIKYTKLQSDCFFDSAKILFKT